MVNTLGKPTKVIMDKEDKATIAKLITSQASNETIVATLRKLSYSFDEITKIYEVIDKEGDQMNKLKALEESFNK